MNKTARLKVLFQLSLNLIKLRLKSAPDKDPKSKQLLFESFKHLGGVYVKFLQLLALNVDFMAGWAGTAEFDVFEAVGYEEIDVISILKTELPDYESSFSSVNTTPFAAGSFAQVYHAHLLDGSPVVIKVLRPSLARNLKADLRTLGFLAWVCDRLFRNQVLKIHDAYRKFAEFTVAESDYKREVSNAKWFYEYFRDHPSIKVPKTYETLSTKHLITQDLIGGISLAQVMEFRDESGYDSAQAVRALVGSDLWKQMEVLSTEFLISSVKSGFIFGDPHPGNIKLLPENKIGLIDFGLVAPTPTHPGAWLELLKEKQKLYSDAFDAGTFTIALLKYYDPELAQALTAVDQALNPEEPEDILTKIGHSAAIKYQKRMNEPRMQMLLRRKMITRIFASLNEGNRYGVKVDLDNAAALRASHTFLVLLGSLSTQGENFEVVRRALAQAITFAEEQTAMYPSTPLMSTEQALEFVSSWLSNIADRDPSLFQELTANMESSYA